MKIRLAVSLAAIAALALPVAAQAALPKTSDTLIVPTKSIGGVALGGSPTAVTKAWGKNAECEFQCLYEGPRHTGETPSLGSVLLETRGNAVKVWEIFITVGENDEGVRPKPNFDTPLTRFKTAKGIGLGSTAAELTRAYHGLKKQSSPDFTYYTLKGPKESATVFSAPAGKITEISIMSHPGG
jgi:hypothetical protein